MTSNSDTNNKALLDPDTLPPWLASQFTSKYQSSRILTTVNDDDCATIRIGKELVVMTTDFINANPIMLELRIGGFYELGRMLVAHNISDLLGSGAHPRFLLLGLTLKSDTTKLELENLILGIQSEAKKHKVAVIGGDTKLGKSIALSATAIGTASSKRNLFLKSGARAGDLLWVSGDIGSVSAAVLGLKEKTLSVDTKKWAEAILTEPSLPISKSKKISRLMLGNGGVDLSDGLGVDLISMCESSNVGVVLDLKSIPISENATRVAIRRGIPPWALAFASGGDFQFIVTTKKSAERKMNLIGFTRIGKVTNQNSMLMIEENGTERSIPKIGHRDSRQMTFYEEIRYICGEVTHA